MLLMASLMHRKRAIKGYSLETAQSTHHTFYQGLNPNHHGLLTISRTLHTHSLFNMQHNLPGNSQSQKKIVLKTCCIGTVCFALKHFGFMYPRSNL